jgi:hypothetical protein
MYVHMCIKCIYKYIHACVCFLTNIVILYIYIYVYIYIYIYIYIIGWLSEPTCAGKWSASIHMRKRDTRYMHMHVTKYTYMHMHITEDTHAHVRALSQPHICTYVCIYTYIHIHVFDEVPVHPAWLPFMPIFNSVASSPQIKIP